MHTVVEMLTQKQIILSSYFLLILSRIAGSGVLFTQSMASGAEYVGKEAQQGEVCIREGMNDIYGTTLQDEERECQLKFQQV